MTRDDFGVFKFWKELKEEYANMEFRHSYGLGVLFMGENEIINQKEQLELYYSYLLEDIENGKIGILVQENYKFNSLIQQKDQEMSNLNQLIQQKDQEMSNLNQLIQQKDQEIRYITSSKFWKIRENYMKLKKLLRDRFVNYLLL